MSMREDDDDYESEDEDMGTVRHRAREARQTMETGHDDDLIDTADEPSSPETSFRAGAASPPRKKRGGGGLLPNPSEEQPAVRDM